MIRISALALSGALTLAACTVPSGNTSGLQPKGSNISPAGATYSVAPPNAPSGAVIDTFARSFLNNIQAPSIRDRVEYCGYFFVDAAGQLFGTPPAKGTFAGCEMPAPQPGQGIIASYHTHGAYSPRYDNEVPSVIDLESDFEFGIDGYVSTPGGRIWLVDFQTQATRQVCGRSCVYTDPGFRPDGEAGIRQSYSLQSLRQRQFSF